MEPTEYPWCLQVKALLPEAVLAQVQKAMREFPFQDGRSTAGGAAGKVKSNQQMADGPHKQQLDQLVMQHVMAVPDVHKSMFPFKIYPLLYAKYGQGQSYGWHIDSPVMMSQMPIRTDVAMTIFLSEPDSYEGGELEVQGPGGTGLFKLAAGDAIFYPATSLHRVRPVLSGERQVVVTWMQSAVRNPAHRQVLFDIKRVHEALEQDEAQAKSAERLLHSFSALFREWAEI